MQHKFSPDTILMTGATGALGADLLPKLLRRFPESRIVAIVRGKTQQGAEERLIDAVETPELPATQLMERVTVLQGDTTRPRFGLDDETYQQLCAATRRVFHLAANVRFSATLPESRTGNVESTKVVLDFCRDCRDRHPNDFELHYASTAYVVGNRQGPLREDELNCGQGFWNAYEQSKLEAEELALAARKEMSVTVYRPSQVICLSASGKVRKLFGFLEFLKIACTGRAKLTHIPANPKVRSDMVPLDFVSDAMAYLSGEADTRGKTYHLAAGLARTLPLEEIADIAYEIVRAHVPASEPLYKPQYLPVGLLDTGGLEGQMNKSLGGLLKIYQTYLTYDRDFQVEETLQLLAKAGIVLPPMEETLKRSVRYVVEEYFDEEKFALN